MYELTARDEKRATALACVMEAVTEGQRTVRLLNGDAPGSRFAYSGPVYEVRAIDADTGDTTPAGDWAYGYGPALAMLESVTRRWLMYGDSGDDALLLHGTESGEYAAATARR